MISLLAGPICAQSPQSAGSAAQTTGAQPSGSASQQQKISGGTTTVVVHGNAQVSYLPENFTLGTLGAQPLKNAPISATVIPRGVLNDQISRLLSDVVKNDASVQADYVPVGYYGNYAIRGFPIDLATGIEINGMTVAGEQDVPLENKEGVEILQGLAGVESGVAAGGGVIDFITRPPAAVRAIDLATDQRGTAYGAVDIGRFFGGHQQVGTRLDLAGEKIMSYLNGADGWRGVGAGAADWKISPRAVLKGNFEYQHKRERDGSGYQLLGGTALPDINRIYRSTMLGLQPWVKPDTFDTFNTGARLNYTLPRNWVASVAASLSHSLIDDNVIYAYGASLDPDNDYAVNCPDSPDAPAYFFCPDGTYGVYDYRNPGELRMNAVAQAMISGRVRTGAVEHNLAAGGEMFLRSVQMPGFYSVADPYSPDGVTQDGAVYSYVGSANIYEPIADVPPPGSADSLENPSQQAGPRRLWQNSRQSSGILQDRMRLPWRIELIAAGRIDALRDHNYSFYASCADFSAPENCAPVFTDKIIWLPRYATTYRPVENLTLYANYGVLLSLGPQAPWWVDNGSQFLAPYYTRQMEAGAKYELDSRVLFSGDVFRMRAPFFYPRVISGPDSFCPSGTAGDQCFESVGHETHDGLELSAQGNAASWLRLTATAAAIHALSSDTGMPQFDGKQVIDVPRLHTTIFSDIKAPLIAGLHIMPGWTYVSRKNATRDDSVSVPGFNIFDMGASYTPGGEDGRLTFHIYADNIVNKHYWSDTGASLGDTFLWLGAPTTVRLEAHYRFK